MTALCFIDTETTGVHPDRQVWEVAMIRRDDNGADERAFYVDVDLSNADPFGLNIGRFYERHPLGRRVSSTDRREGDNSVLLSRRQAADEIATMTHAAHLVGAVPNFDAETLAPLLREHGYLPAWHYHLIDVEALAVGALCGGGYTVPLPWKSDELSKSLGVEPPTDEERHTALGDARWAMRLYDAIIKPT